MKSIHLRGFFLFFVFNGLIREYRNSVENAQLRVKKPVTNLIKGKLQRKRKEKDVKGRKAQTTIKS